VNLAKLYSNFVEYNEKIKRNISKGNDELYNINPDEKIIDREMNF
jgi:hypothetical protein